MRQPRKIGQPQQYYSIIASLPQVKAEVGMQDRTATTL